MRRLVFESLLVFIVFTDPQGEKGYGLCDKNLAPGPAYTAFKAFTQARKKPRESGSGAGKKEE